MFGRNLILLLVSIFIRFDKPRADIIIQEPIESNVINDNNEIKVNTLCIDGFRNTVVLLTKVDNSTQMNVPLVEDVMAIVSYKCSNVSRFMDKSQYNMIHRLCKNQCSICSDFKQGSEETDKKLILYVELRMPYNVTEIKIKVVRCDEPILNSNNSIDNESKKEQVFRRNISNITPIKLSLFSKNRIIIGDIIFNVTNSKCARGWHKVSLNKVGYKCFINISGVNSEGGYLFWFCDKPRLPGNFVYNFAKNDLCKTLYFNMAECSYICARLEDNQLVEEGYVIKRNINYQGLFLRKNVSIDMVFFNECEYDLKVCTLGPRYCLDEKYSFSCTNGSYDFSECLSGRLISSYWRCPVDKKAMQMLNSSSNSFLNADDYAFYSGTIKEHFQRKITSRKQLSVLFYILRVFFLTKTYTLFSHNNTSFRNEILKYFVLNAFRFFMKATYKNGTETLYYYKKNVSTKDKTINITMKAKPNTTEYVNVQFTDAAAREDNNITVTYLQFNSSDVVDDSREINKRAKRANELKTSLSNDPKKEEKLYKNSLLFSLKVDNISAFKRVEFKLDTLIEVRSAIWMLKIENVCGYLKDNKWSTEGCKTLKNSQGIYCQCDHLSNFAMLFSINDVGGIHRIIFDIFSDIGAILNITFLILFLVFIVFINARDKLRIDQLNIAICLLVGTMLFTFGSFTVDSRICPTVAILTQYFFLCAFVWKLIFGINVLGMLFSLQNHRKDWLKKYRWLFFAVGYIIPLIIVLISGSMDWFAYGSYETGICWIAHYNVVFYSFLLPIGIILGINTICFFFITKTLILNYVHTYKTKLHESSEMFVFIQLFVSMGLTWIPSVFAIYYVWAMYLVVIFFPLQGVMMFFLVVVINEENRMKVSSFVSQTMSRLSSLYENKHGSKSNEYSIRTSNERHEKEYAMIGIDEMEDMNIKSS